MQDSIQIMLNEIIKILRDNHPSVYLFGSIALDDFRPGWSDIDILCLTESQISKEQAEELVSLRQQLMGKYPGNPYFRLFEGGFLSMDAFFKEEEDTVVYWGTSGQRITDHYTFDVFSRMELLDSGRLLYGKDIRGELKYPGRKEQLDAVINHYNTIRKYAGKTGRSLYSAGWLLDTARCIYTLQTGKIIAKTQAGIWALENKLVPDEQVMKRAIAIRQDPARYKTEEETLKWLETLEPYVQAFADRLEAEIAEAESL